MKRLTLIFSLLAISSQLFAQISKVPDKNIPADYGYIVKIGQQLPDFEMTLADGKTVKTSDLKGKVVMLQFTASWCSVCRKEMPHIEKDIWQKHKNNKDFALYGIDLDEPLVRGVAVVGLVFFQEILPVSDFADEFPDHGGKRRLSR